MTAVFFIGTGGNVPMPLRHRFTRTSPHCVRRPTRGLFPLHRSRSSCLSAILCRSAAVDLPERPRKIAAVLKAALPGDLGHTQTGAAQKLCCTLGAPVPQILVRRCTDHIMEAPQALTGADGGTGRDLIDRDILGVVILNVLEHLLDAVALRSAFLGIGQADGAWVTSCQIISDRAARALNS